MAGLTRTKNKSEFADGSVVVCVQAFATEEQAVATGERRVVDDLVRMSEKHWVIDGATTAEIGAKVAALYDWAESPPLPAPVVRQERRLVDEDALVNIHSGERVRRGSKLAMKADFVPVATPGVERADALMLTKTLSIVGTGGVTERTVYAGTWIDADDPLAKLHPHHLALLTPPARKEG